MWSRTQCCILTGLGASVRPPNPRGMQRIARPSARCLSRDSMMNRNLTETATLARSPIDRRYETMPETPLLLGTLDLLILKALSLQPLHGLGVSRRVEQITRGTYIVRPGS